MDGPASDATRRPEHVSSVPTAWWTVDRSVTTIRQGLTIRVRGDSMPRQVTVPRQLAIPGDNAPASGGHEHGGGASAAAAPPPGEPPKAEGAPESAVVPAGRVCPGCAFLQGQKTGGRQHLWKPPCVRDPRYQRGPYQRRE